MFGKSKTPDLTMLDWRSSPEVVTATEALARAEATEHAAALRASDAKSAAVSLEELETLEVLVGVGRADPEKLAEAKAARAHAIVAADDHQRATVEMHRANADLAIRQIAAQDAARSAIRTVVSSIAKDMADHLLKAAESNAQLRAAADAIEESFGPDALGQLGLTICRASMTGVLLPTAGDPNLAVGTELAVWLAEVEATLGIPLPKQLADLKK